MATSVSLHALQRYLERIGVEPLEHTVDEILQLWHKGTPVVQLVNRGLHAYPDRMDPAEYRISGPWVLVVREGVIVTLYENPKDGRFAPRVRYLKCTQRV